MKYLFVSVCLLALAWPALAQEQRTTTQDSIADGITLSARGYATNFDRFVLVLVPTVENDGPGNFLPSEERRKRYQAVQREIMRVLEPFGIKEQTPVVQELTLSQMPGGSYAIGFLLPHKFDGKMLGSGTVAEVMGAVTKAGAFPVGQLLSSYSPTRTTQARRDALKDAMQVGQAEAKEIVSIIGQKVGKVLGVRVEAGYGALFGTSTRRVDSSGVLSEQFASNSVALMIRFAIK